jgi:cytoskeletal protein CcmA (bactofilin family)
MSFNDFRKGRETEPSTKPSTKPSTSNGGVGALTAFIDQGSEFSGKLSFKDTVRIDGRFEGEIASENTLIVGESGQVHANITSEIVIVSGEVRGDILARSQIHLHKSGRVFGDIQTKALVIEVGAQLNGQVQMGDVKMPRTPDKKPAEQEKAEGDDKPSEQPGQTAS